MKMNSAQIQQTLHTLNAAELNAEAIPAGHPMMSSSNVCSATTPTSSTAAASTSWSPSRPETTAGWVSWSISRAGPT